MNDEPPETPNDEPGTLRDEAALWFARMRGDRADEFRPRFEKWLERGALHRAAYNQVGEVFASAKVLKDVGNDAKTGASMSARVPGSLLATLVAATLALVVGIGVASYWPAPGIRWWIPAANAQTVTRIGQIERLRLSNGAAAVLDTNSLLVSRVDGASNVFRLDHGRLRVALGAGHPPMTVRAGNSELRAREGTFDLSVAPDGAVEVTVFDGSVVLTATAVAGAGPVRIGSVSAGTQLALDGAGRARLLRANESATWPQGILEFHDAPLGVILAEANRYSLIRIVAADPSISRLRVSGRFRIDDASALARRLALALGLAVDRPAGERIVLARR